MLDPYAPVGSAVWRVDANNPVRVAQMGTLLDRQPMMETISVATAYGVVFFFEDELFSSREDAERFVALRTLARCGP